MATQFNLPFSWDRVDMAYDFNRLQMVLDSLPDAHIIRVLERLNSRIAGKFENHYIRGKAKMNLRLGLAFGVMMALAVGQIKADRSEYMRSLYAGAG